MTTTTRSTHSPATAPALSHAELADLALELRRECARVERSLATGDTSSEHHELLMALARIEDGTYGSCLRCGGAIPVGRLLVMPATQHCVDCGL